MFYYQPNNQYILEGIPFEINGVQYPANWLNLSTPEEKINIGIEEVITTNFKKDDRYYWVSEELSGATLTYINTPKDLDTVKQTVISQLNTTAYTLLLPSDWMVTRFTETGVDISPEWKLWRESIRSKYLELETQVNNAEDVDTIADLIIDWPPDPTKKINDFNINN